MILAWLILIPILGGLLAWLAARWQVLLARWVALTAMAITLAIALVIWAQHWGVTPVIGHAPWLLEYARSWIPQLGITVHLAMDGISLLMVLLTAVLGVLSVAASWNGIQQKVGLFHFTLLWSFAGIMGVFLSFDLFLFYFFWELMLVPLYFLIDIWGHEHRHYAAIKFFLFTQAGGLFLLIAILGLYFLHGQHTGVYTFDYVHLLHTPIAPAMATWLMLGFFVAFAVKLPAVPVHTWLPDAHTQAPIAGSVDLAGLVLKVGAYGLLRFTIPLFPTAALQFAPVAMTLAVVSIIYGALLAFAQTDLKRLVAYTSVSHMGFVLLGIFAWNELALQGAVLILIAHGITTGALFMLVGEINERLHTRDMDRMGGIWAVMPRIGGVGMFFALASLALPGLGNFIGEILVLFGTYRVSPLFAAVASVGFVLSVVYSLRIVQRVFFGPLTRPQALPDLTTRETVMMTGAIAITLWLGLYPQPVLNTAVTAVRTLVQTVRAATPARGGPRAIPNVKTEYYQPRQRPLSLRYRGGRR